MIEYVNDVKYHKNAYTNTSYISLSMNNQSKNVALSFKMIE